MAILRQPEPVVSPLLSPCYLSPWICIVWLNLFGAELSRAGLKRRLRPSPARAQPVGVCYLSLPFSVLRTPFGSPYHPLCYPSHSPSNRSPKISNFPPRSAHGCRRISLFPASTEGLRHPFCSLSPTLILTHRLMLVHDFIRRGNAAPRATARRRSPSPSGCSPSSPESSPSPPVATIERAVS